MSHVINNLKRSFIINIDADNHVEIGKGRSVFNKETFELLQGCDWFNELVAAEKLSVVIPAAPKSKKKKAD